MKSIKILISLLLIVALLPWGGLNIVFAQNFWDSYEGGTRMPFRPADGYVSLQNPPDFTWPYVDGADSYWLVVSRDETFNSIDFEKRGLNTNYYNFDTAFETGVRYYWKVCAFVNNTQTDWSEAKSFRIDPDAYIFTVSDIDTLIKKVSPSHPRVLTTDVEAFRSIKDTNETSAAVYERFVNNARTYMQRFAESFPPDPDLSQADYWNEEFNTYYPDKYTEYVYGMNEYKKLSAEMLAAVSESAFAYLISGDEEIGEFAKRALLELSGWDITGATSHVFDNQRHRDIVYRGAMAYDWVYDLMTEEERKTVRDMIYNRITHVYTVKRYRTNADGSIMTDENGQPLTTESKVSMSDIFTNMKKVPFDSHGWTTLGFLGIAAYSLLGDYKAYDPSLEMDTAEAWLRDVLPLYTAIMHPWSNQDGGWSQGTNYWQFGNISSKEFTDILALGGVINLYDKAWSKNEYLWSLYAYPTGSYGSFGDGANRDKAEYYSYTRNGMARTAYFTENPVAAWISQSQGGAPLTEFYSYYAAQAVTEEAKPPEGYPLSHTFKDVGWTVMTSDITNPERVQLTFKSSPYGTYNHSQQDQNAFIIQAFGENLAIKSGFYDYYASEHDKNVSRATYARNTITVDGNWQVDQDIDADGEIVQFVGGSEFDVVLGSAADAYGSMLDKYDRIIIYLRPDAFIVIDDLVAAGEGESTFEWWLNAQSSIEWTDSSALITEGDAHLRADVIYPENTTCTYYDGFINPKDNKEYPPTGSYAEREPHKRVAFKTEKTAATKMVVAMNVFEDGTAEKSIKSESFDGYIKLSLEDKAVYISTGDTKSLVNTYDGISFKGAAAVISDTSALLANGTYLKIGESVIVENASAPISAVFEDGRLSLSGGEDFNVTLNKSGSFISDINALTDEKGRKLSPAVGISAADSGESVSFSAEKGTYVILNSGPQGLPAEYGAENISMQKSADGSAAVFWEEIPGVSYDVKIDDEIFLNQSSPLLFTVEDGMKTVSVREKRGFLAGGWSESCYVSAYDKEYHDKIDFSFGQEGENTYIYAKTKGIPSFGVFDMYLAGYDENGVLKEAVLAEKDGYEYSAKISFPDGGSAKAFIFGKNLAPLASAAEYGSDSTALSGIFLDGVLIDGFDNNLDYYEVSLGASGMKFPYVSAYAADNSSKVQIVYNFSEPSASVEVTSQAGRKRTVKILFTSL